jgi:hypothetical protein
LRGCSLRVRAFRLARTKSVAMKSPPPRNPNAVAAPDRPPRPTTDAVSGLAPAVRKARTKGRKARFPQSDLSQPLDRVRRFDEFTNGNDPHGEHDFGSIKLEGVTYFFKLDYYAPDMDGGSEDPADPEKTMRVLTIMGADEY